MVECRYRLSAMLFILVGLENNGCQPQLSTLKIFDYLSTTTAQTAESIQKPFRVLYAGGLAKRKNTFLYEIGDHMSSYTLNLYGKKG